MQSNTWNIDSIQYLNYIDSIQYLKYWNGVGNATWQIGASDI